MGPRVFLYEHLIDRILNAGPDWPRIIVWGGPCLGKSVFLSRIQEEFAAAFDTGPPLLIARRTEDGRRRIRAWASEPKGMLLIDDLNHLWDPDVDDSLKSLPEDDTATWRIIAAAGSIDSIEERADLSGSPSLNTFHRERLDPWELSRQARGAVKDALELTCAELAQAGGGGELPAFLSAQENPMVVETWLQALLETTGGHPSLVEPAFEGFLRLVQTYPDLRPELLAEPRGDRRGWRTSIKLYLEDYVLDKGMIGVNKAIRSFKNTRKFPHLVQLATGGAQSSVIHEAVVRYALRDSGLAYISHETGRLVVACELIRQRILEMADETSIRAEAGQNNEVQRIQITVVESPSLPEVEGRLRYETEQGEVGEVAVSGGPWRILRCLAGRAGGPISVAELGKLTGLGTEAATRSAIQRLLQTLREKNLSGVVENIRGRGYQLGGRPVVVV